MALPFRPQPAEGNFAVRVIVGDLALERLCVKCIASRGFTRFAVEAIVAEIRRWSSTRRRAVPDARAQARSS